MRTEAIFMALMECSLCGKTADAREMKYCETCRAPLCPKCSFLNLGMCVNCAEDEEEMDEDANK